MSNPELVKGPIFQQLIPCKHYLDKIANDIINVYNTIQKPIVIGDKTVCLETFYNKVLLDKFINNLSFDYLTKQDINDNDLYIIYQDFCQAMTDAANKVKVYLEGIIVDPKWQTHPTTGLGQYSSNISTNDIYKFAFEYITLV